MSPSDPSAAMPQPAEDPTFWLLNQRVGWRVANLQKLEIAANHGLRLEPAPGAELPLTEPKGSFGALVPPCHVALDAGSNLYLLDKATAALKIFDRCDCRFVVVPCFAGIGSGARQLGDARCITIGNGNLYVADAGNHCVKVFSLVGFALRALWKLPPSANVADWQPCGLACDRDGQVYVSDAAQGRIDSFTRTGKWSLFASGLGKAGAIAIDCRDQLYVVAGAALDEVRAFDLLGKPLTAPARAHELAAYFSTLPFSVDAQGNLDLTGWCIEQGCASTGQRLRFDPRGNLLKNAPAQATTMALYQTQGSYLSQALDSRLYRCQWHRVVLHGELPPGASAVVATYTAETEVDPDQISLLPESAWETKQTAYQMEKGSWDCLVRNGGGRFLWLRLTLQGTGLVTPTLQQIRVEYPRVSLRRYLPAVFGADPISADFSDRFLGLFDTTLRTIETQIQEQARLFDPMATPATTASKRGVDFLSWLASWVGISFDRQMPEAKRRLWLANAATLHQLRGTRTGLWRQLLLFLGIEPEAVCCCEEQPKSRCQPQPANCAPVVKQPCAWQPPPLILEHFQLRRWLFLGAGRLGDQAEVWGRSLVNRSQLDENAQADHTRLLTTQDPVRDPFHLYAHKFSVFVPARYGRSEGDRRALQNVIRLAMPGHTQMNLEYVEPRFRIGFQATIGLNSVVGCYPAGVTLQKSALGVGTVLSGTPQPAEGPTLTIGKKSRVGSTTRLE